jgi:spore coat polysaccharide biosynthesis protein SpsF
MKTLIIIQARTGSSRLPNKVMLPLAGKPLLQRMIERVQASKCRNEMVVATSIEPEDDPIRDLCRSIGVRCYSGHPTDLLERHYQAALREGADIVVKIPSDCPMIDPAVIDRVVEFHRTHPALFDFVSNLHPATYPDGNDVEVMSMEVLECARREAVKDYEREHTTPFIWEQPGRFKLGSVLWETGLNYSMSHRWTIDYPEDYLFIKSVYDELWRRSPGVFSINDVLQLLKERPELARINERYAGVNWYRNHINELRTISSAETKHLVHQ